MLRLERMSGDEAFVDIKPVHDYEYNYGFVFFFERKFYDQRFTGSEKRWLKKNWSISILYSVVYILAVFLGQYLMKKREKFHLYRSLIAWNILLAGFSIIGAIRFLPNFFQILYAKGFEHSVCVLDYDSGVSGCWTLFFIISKVVELMDTFFIIMRKQRLMFLHWYHHATVLVYCWYSLKDLSSTGRWFVAMNYTVHSLMYTYYAFRALRFTIPKFVNVIITSLQLSQMIIGIYINTMAYKHKNSGKRCDVTYENIYWSFFMYFTYFVLFGHFFINAYLKKPKNESTIKNVNHPGKKLD